MKNSCCTGLGAIRTLVGFLGILASSCGENPSNFEATPDGGGPCEIGETTCIDNDVFTCVDGRFTLFDQCTVFGKTCRLVLGEAQCTEGSTEQVDGDIDADTDGDGDGDADGDGDTDGDVDGDTDGDTLTDTDSDSGFESDSNVESDSSTATGTMNPLGSDTEGDTDSDATTDTISASELDSDSETTSDTDGPYCASHYCWRVNPTHQSNCYDNTGLVNCPPLPCDEDGGIAFCGQDAQYPQNERTFTCYSQGAPLAQCSASIGIDQEETVVESLNGLVWSRDYVIDRTWSAAHDYCDTLVLAGDDDWRLPSYVEYTSILDYSRTVPATDPVPFPDAEQYYYWLSHPLALAPDQAGWNLNLDFGNLVTMSKDGTAGVRCVRGGNLNPVDPDRYPVFGEAPREWVRDQATGLEWQLDRQLDLTWEQALRYCEAEIPWDATDEEWRLPSINELSSLLNHGRNYPAMDFPYTEDVAGTFWSATTVTASLDQGYAVEFTQGYVLTESKTGAYRVRCVRGGP